MVVSFYLKVGAKLKLFGENENQFKAKG